jgi:hypothetical protein
MKYAIIEFYKSGKHAPLIRIKDAWGLPFTTKSKAEDFARAYVDPNQMKDWSWAVVEVEDSDFAFGNYSKDRPPHPSTMIGRTG